MVLLGVSLSFFFFFFFLLFRVWDAPSACDFVFFFSLCGCVCRPCAFFVAFVFFSFFLMVCVDFFVANFHGPLFTVSGFLDFHGIYSPIPFSPQHISPTSYLR